MLYSVRVRGIYATALAALALKRGYLLSDLSRKLLERIDVPTASKPPNITVKHGEESGDEVLVHAYPYESGLMFERDLLDEAVHASVRRAPLGLRSIVDVRMRGDCVGEGPEGILVYISPGEECPAPGDVVRVTVRKSEPGSKVVEASRGIELTGLTVRVAYPSSGFSISRHLKGEEASKALEAIHESGVDLSNFRVRVRSGARLASKSDIALEIRGLAEKAYELYTEEPSTSPRLVERGEYLSLIYLPSTAKERLDSLRRSLYPTIHKHHSFKSWLDDREGLLVDFSEEGVKKGLWREEVGGHLEDFIASRLVGSRISILHAKPSGERIQIGPFRVVSYRQSSPGKGELVLERKFTRKGMLDALNIPKEPGYSGVTRVFMGEWITIHEYYSSNGSLVGVYANINTPPEIGFSGIKYLDLYIDVVKKPGEEPLVVDQEQLEESCEEGFLTKSLCSEARTMASRTVGLLKSRYP